MTLAQKKIFLALRLLQTENKEILKAVDLLFEQENENYELTLAQKNELDKRLKSIEDGTAKFFTWEEAKKRILKK
ncbi:MAG: addiction module protein [Bacteroidota bacterium]